MNILLLATNRERAPYPVPPLGALAVAATAQQAGHRVHLLDMMFVRSVKHAIRAALRVNDFQAVALSIRNLDNCLYHCPKSYAETARQMAQEVREITEVPLVLGGSGFSLAPKRWLRQLDASFGVVGEAEKAFPALLEQIASKKPVRSIPGVMCAEEPSEAHVNPSEASMAEAVRPAHHLCDYDRYLSDGGYISIQTKRGCPYRCIYCTYPQLEGCHYRLRDPESIVDEIEFVNSKNKSCAVYFADSVFNTPREHALAVCWQMARRKVAVPWMTYCNPLGFDLELAGAMVDAGCVGVEFGLDSATEKMLSVLQKPFTLSDIKHSFKAAAKVNLPFAVHLLFGGPGETVDDIRETQKFLDSCNRPNAVFATLGIRIYPETPIEQIARREGVLSADDDLFEPAYYVSVTLSDKPIKVLDRIARKRPAWSTATDWNGLILRTLQKIANRSGIRPQWLNAANYGKYMRW
jgi:radical SAM superfamily enzyme YgiQ (UPF0313 family)